MNTQGAQQGEPGAAPSEEQPGGREQPSGTGAAGAAAGPGATEGAGGSAGPSEQERLEMAQREAYEAELSRITSADMVLQATVSLLNIGARRLGLLGGAGGADSTAAQQVNAERDLEQVRDAIDAVRGLMGVIERRAPQEARPLRDALSQLQMAYAREVSDAPAPPAQAGAQGAPAGSPPSGPAADRPPAVAPGKPGAGPAESSGRLWVPGR